MPDNSTLPCIRVGGLIDPATCIAADDIYWADLRVAWPSGRTLV